MAGQAAVLEAPAGRVSAVEGLVVPGRLADRVERLRQVRQQPGRLPADVMPLH